MTVCVISYPCCFGFSQEFHCFPQIDFMHLHLLTKLQNPANILNGGQ